MRAFVRAHPYRTWPYYDWRRRVWGVVTSLGPDMVERPNGANEDAMLFYPGTESLAFGPRGPVEWVDRDAWFIEQLQKLVQDEARLLTRGASYGLHAGGSFWREEDRCVFTGTGWTSREDLPRTARLVHSLADFVRSQRFGNIVLLESGARYVLHLEARVVFTPEKVPPDLAFDYWELRALHYAKWPISLEPWKEANTLEKHWLIEIEAEYRTRLFSPGKERGAAPEVQAIVAIPHTPEGRVLMWLQRDISAKDAWRNARWTLEKREYLKRFAIRGSGVLELSGPCNAPARLDISETANKLNVIGGWHEVTTMTELRRRLLNSTFGQLKWTGEEPYHFDADTIREARRDELAYLVHAARDGDPQSLVLYVRGSELRQPLESPPLLHFDLPDVDPDNDWIMVASRWRTSFFRLTDSVSFQSARAVLTHRAHNLSALIPHLDREVVPAHLEWTGERKLDLTLRTGATDFMRWLTNQPRRLVLPPAQSVARLVVVAPAQRDASRKDLVAQTAELLKETQVGPVRVDLGTEVTTLRLFEDEHLEGVVGSKEELCKWLYRRRSELLYVSVGAHVVGLLQRRPSHRLFTQIWALVAGTEVRLFAVTKNLVRELDGFSGAFNWATLEDWFPSPEEEEKKQPEEEKKKQYLVLHNDVYAMPDLTTTVDHPDALERVQRREQELRRDFHARLDVHAPFVTTEGQQEEVPAVPFLAFGGPEPVYVHPTTFTMQTNLTHVPADELLYLRAIRATVERLFAVPAAPLAETSETDLEARKFLLQQLKAGPINDDTRHDFRSLCAIPQEERKEERKAPQTVAQYQREMTAIRARGIGKEFRRRQALTQARPVLSSGP